MRRPARFGAPHPLFDAPGIRDFDVAHRSDRIVALLPVEPIPSSRCRRAELAVVAPSPEPGTSHSELRTCNTNWEFDTLKFALNARAQAA